MQLLSPLLLSSPMLLLPLLPLLLSTCRWADASLSKLDEGAFMTAGSLLPPLMLLLLLLLPSPVGGPSLHRVSWSVFITAI
jgi:hypothetical protein